EAGGDTRRRRRASSVVDSRVSHVGIERNEGVERSVPIASSVRGRDALALDAALACRAVTRLLARATAASAAGDEQGGGKAGKPTETAHRRDGRQVRFEEQDDST